MSLSSASMFCHVPGSSGGEAESELGVERRPRHRRRRREEADPGLRRWGQSVVVGHRVIGDDEGALRITSYARAGDPRLMKRVFTISSRAMNMSGISWSAVAAARM